MIRFFARSTLLYVIVILLIATSSKGASVQNRNTGYLNTTLPQESAADLVEGELVYHMSYIYSQ